MTNATEWTIKDVPNLQDKVAIVTGANSGIGFYTALELGRAGAKTILVSRDKVRGEAALAEMRKLAPNASFILEQLDLASLQSVKSFADRFLSSSDTLDLLVNNAGLMMPPKRETTIDGFEIQFGTNHLGHFALTGLLLPALKNSSAPRVVTVSSLVAMRAKINLSDLQCEQKYVPYAAYGQSKLANLLFMLELGRREPWLTSVAAHPGATITNLQKHAFGLTVKIIGQSADQGALPTLRAAVEPKVSGKFFGPKNLFGARGAPIEVRLPKQSLDQDTARSLWQTSEILTGIRYENAAGYATRSAIKR